ncbi:MAG: hypothetical protein AAFP13_13945 [Pseudomonadota bacterium]
MPSTEFAERLARIEANRASPQQPEARSRAERKRKGTSWLLWVGAAALLGVAGLLVVMSDGPSGPGLEDVFTGESAAAYDGALTPVTLAGRAVEMQIPTDWRAMTPSEVSAAGESFAALGDVTRVANFTSDAADGPAGLRVHIFSQETQAPDAIVPIAVLQGIMEENTLMMRVVGFDLTFLTEPETITVPGVSSAAQTVGQQALPEGDMAMIYRAYVLGAETVTILLLWRDTDVHPSAFYPVLDSLRPL